MTRVGSHRTIIEEARAKATGTSRSSAPVETVGIVSRNDLMTAILEEAPV